MDEFHREVRLGTKSRVRRARLVDLSNAGMLKPTQSLGLALEAPQQVLAGETRFDYFQSDGAAWMVLFGLIDGSHPAFADQTEHTIPTDLFRQPARRDGRPSNPDSLPHGRAKRRSARDRLLHQTLHFTL